MKTIKCKCGQDILIDDEDVLTLNNTSFECLTSKFGTVRLCGANKTPITYLLKGSTPTESFWDHANRNKHDNQKLNLRLATRSQNNANRVSYGKLPYKGVKKANSKWMARITVDKKEIYLGVFVEIEDAARAYDTAATLHFGEFACLNFPKP